MKHYHYKAAQTSGGGSDWCVGSVDAKSPKHARRQVHAVLQSRKAQGLANRHATYSITLTLREEPPKKAMEELAR